MRVVAFFDAPYRHFTADSVLEETAAQALRDWLHGNGPEWVPHTEEHSDQWSCVLSPKRHPVTAEVLTPAVIGEFRRSMEQQFNKRFAERVMVSASRVHPSGSVGVHNDYRGEPGTTMVDEKGRPYETHRLIIGLTENHSFADGGFAAIVGGPNHDSPIVRLIRPVFNTAYAFEQGPDSYHAVTEVWQRDRINIACYFFPPS